MTVELARLHSRAWRLLTLALALHLGDEAWTDVLSVYNPALEELSRRWGWAPLPSLNDAGFFILTGGAVLGLALISPWIHGARRGAYCFSDLFAGFMMGNAVGHLVLSWQTGRLMPGTASSPLLLAGGAYLSWTAWRRRRKAASAQQR